IRDLGLDDGSWRQDHGIFFRCQTSPLKYSYMLGGMFSSCACAMCLRTVSEYWKRSPQMRQCHCSRAKMYGRHSGLFGSSLGLGIFKSCKKNRNHHSDCATTPLRGASIRITAAGAATAAIMHQGGDPSRGPSASSERL